METMSSTSAVTLRRAHELNLKAVDLIVSDGDIPTSLMYLRQALHIVRNNMFVQTTDSKNDSSSSVGSFVVDVIHLDTDNDTRDQQAYSNDFNLFQGVFIASQDPTRRSWQNGTAAVSDDMETLVLLYNFAFALHKSGLSSKEGQVGCDRALSKALQLYQMAHACVLNLSTQVPTCLQTMVLAIVTNQGHIHSHFFQQKEAQAAHDYLRRFLNDHVDPSSMLDQDYMFFHEVSVTSAFARSKLPPAA